MGEQQHDIDTPSARFTKLVTEALEAKEFRLLDIGCSGGIDQAWRTFGDCLFALGIDASVTECRQLAENESNPNVAYLAAFASGLRAEPIDPVGVHSKRTIEIVNRMSVMRAREIDQRRLAAASTDEKMRHNAWGLTELANPSEPVVPLDLLNERGWSALDYLKIDVDGLDFQILQSFAGSFATLGVVAVQLEVNFIGTDNPGEHTFHNTDRFMRAQGFDLFRLDVRNYSARALPARFAITVPAQTVSGRPLQGEAYYARDVAGSDITGSADQLLKQSAVFSIWGVPDAAAELLLAHRDRLSHRIDLEHALDLLAAQSQPGTDQPLPYRAYMEEFERQTPRFFPPPPEPRLVEVKPTFWQRLQAAHYAFHAKRYEPEG
jgi:Methyltransferase FkbM domain